MARNLTTRFQLRRTAGQLQTRSQRIQTQGTRYKVEGLGTSRTPKLGAPRPRRAARTARPLNLRRLRGELADLPRFSSFLQRREERMRSQIRTIPGDVLRTVFMGSGIPRLLQPYYQAMAWYQFFIGLDESWFGKRDRVDREEEDEDTPKDTKEPEVIVIYRDREEQEQEQPTQIGDTFGNHQKLLFGHIDKIISLLQGLNEKPYRKDTVTSTKTPFLGNRNNRNDEDDARPMLATLLAGLAGAITGLLSGGDSSGSGSNPLLSGLSRTGQLVAGALSGNALGRMLRDRRTERRADRRRNARRIRGAIRQTRRSGNRLRGLTRPITSRRSIIARTAGGLGRGTVTLLRTLRRIARIGGVAGAIAIPILEWFERSEQMREIQQNPNLTDRERELAEAQVWVEGIADVLAVSGGALIGGLAVLIPGIGPFIGLITSGIGAWLGQMGADWFNRNYADDVARFLVDSDATNAIQSFVDGVVNFPTTLLRSLEMAISSNPLLFAPLLPLLPVLREQRERAQARRVRLPPEPPEEPIATPVPPQRVAEEPLRQLEEIRTTVPTDSNIEIEPGEHDHTHEISSPTRRSSQAIVVREVHTLIYKSNQLVVAR